MDLSQLTTTSVGLAKGARTCNKEALRGVGCCQPGGASTSTCPAVLCVWPEMVTGTCLEARKKKAADGKPCSLNRRLTLTLTRYLSMLSLLFPPPLCPLRAATTAAAPLRINRYALPMPHQSNTHMHMYTPPPFLIALSQLRVSSTLVPSHQS